MSIHSYNPKDAKILIIDDNKANVLILKKILNVHGYKNAITLVDSREALDTYLQYHPDLLLLDLKMPYLDGFEVLDQLNEVKGDDDYLPVIVITAQSDKENRLKAFELGAKDFIGKPFDPFEILMRINNVLEIRMLHNKFIEQNKNLEKMVQERTKELEYTQTELIRRLLMAAEFRDNDTGSHISRIGSYCYEFGKLLEFSEKRCEIFYYASMMHDIGKIGIPDEILLKPSKLNASEWTKMKTHTITGSKLLTNGNSDTIKLAEKIALTHHEKFDGTGYPNGLKGKEIPLEGRIAAICDVFDALLSKRPYKDPWTLDDVIEEIKKGIGTHFDPHLAKMFLDNISIFIDIANGNTLEKY